MTQVPDLLTAMIAFLKSDTDTARLTVGRVWGEDVPERENKNMPCQAIVIRNAGNPGYGAGESYLQVAGTRLDMVAYGDTKQLSSDVYRCLYGALRQMQRNVQGRTVIHWAKLGGGPNTGVEPDTRWPFTLSSWQIMWSEQEAPPV